MGVRILGIIFSLIFAFGVGLIGFALSDPYLDFIHTIYYGNENILLGTVERLDVISKILFSSLGSLIGFLLGSIMFRRIVAIGKNLRRIPAEDKIACTIGTILFSFPAIVVAILLVKLLSNPLLYSAVVLLESVLFIWLGNVVMLSMKEELKFLSPSSNRNAAVPDSEKTTGSTKLLDTNVIIDGRIYDICRTGFMEGEIILPGFILEELQHIADSPDPLRRNRGRRGLDILNQMQKELDTVIQVMDRYKVNFSPGDPVDIKLVKLAKSLGEADIVTNDYNLNKVAKIHGVRVLNINELANAVKPVVLPGEEMQISIIREGKEYNQGVGYLDDGTMVVVENGKRMMGETVAVSVSSVLQTVAGKMIFAELRHDAQQEASDEYGSYHAGRGNRRKTST